MIFQLPPQSNYESRTIDIDILFYDDIIIEVPHLTSPHPLIAMRRFTLVPLNEIASDLKHPVTQLSVEETLDKCNDCSEVIKLDIDTKINCKISLK